jgi:hypothetical protein
MNVNHVRQSRYVFGQLSYRIDCGRGERMHVILAAVLVTFYGVDDSGMHNLALGKIDPFDLSVDGLPVDEGNWP